VNYSTFHIRTARTVIVRLTSEIVWLHNACVYSCVAQTPSPHKPANSPSMPAIEVQRGQQTRPHILCLHRDAARSCSETFSACEQSKVKGTESLPGEPLLTPAVGHCPFSWSQLRVLAVSGPHPKLPTLLSCRLLP
jgi:hypothetical protein